MFFKKSLSNIRCHCKFVLGTFKNIPTAPNSSQLRAGALGALGTLEQVHTIALIVISHKSKMDMIYMDLH